MVSSQIMAKHWEMFDHTADAGLAGRGESLCELFEAMAEGLARFICPSPPAEPRETRRVDVEAEDIEALMVEFLSAVLAVIQAEHMVVGPVRVEEASPRAVRARLLAERYDPRRHELAAEVKAITWHKLQVTCENDTWTARVILDI